MHTAWTDGELSWSYTELDEIDDIARMLAKETVCEHMFFGPNSPEVTHAYFVPLVGPMRGSLSRGELPETHVFTIRAVASRGFVGECALVPVPYSQDNYVVGYQLDDPWWGKGYGTRACGFLIWYAFAVLDAHRLSGDCLASNLPSARIMEKWAFRREGVQRSHYHAGSSGGERVDNLLYGLLRDELTCDLRALGHGFRPLEPPRARPPKTGGRKSG